MPIRGPLDPTKVAAIRERLRSAFSSHGVADLYEPDRSSHCYLLDRGDAVEHRIFVSKEFVDDHTVEEIQVLLQEWHLMDAIRAADDRIVTVTNQGIRVEAERRRPGQQ